MKIVKEHINFERGIDPKTAMDIGVISNIEWDQPPKNIHYAKTSEIIKFIPDFYGYPILIMKITFIEKYAHWASPFNQDYVFFGVSINGLGRTSFTSTAENAEKNIKRLIQGRIKRGIR